MRQRKAINVPLPTAGSTMALRAHQAFTQGSSIMQGAKLRERKPPSNLFQRQKPDKISPCRLSQTQICPRAHSRELLCSSALKLQRRTILISKRDERYTAERSPNE
ncbi:hypothetical protein FGO68_gene3226 [Halteria grandinella]|uniref:Uncharacterized protein n=1 Tax=Halteria grandinella TaxID=5974 RepID=A0A8J8NXD6_HALGN|nr:hypothetical protein FGO68_gene3226 [Halteria grandinella]